MRISSCSHEEYGPQAGLRRDQAKHGDREAWGLESMGIQRNMKTQVMPVRADSDSICREYARPGGRLPQKQERPDFRREREKMKEALLPFVRETVKKQLKEEREYYRSRPSLAARQLEGVLGQGQMIPVITGRVCEQVERRIRLERLRHSP